MAAHHPVCHIVLHGSAPSWLLCLVLANMLAIILAQRRLLVLASYIHTMSLTTACFGSGFATYACVQMPLPASLLVLALRTNRVHMPSVNINTTSATTFLPTCHEAHVIPQKHSIKSCLGKAWWWSWCLCIRWAFAP